MNAWLELFQSNSLSCLAIMVGAAGCVAAVLLIRRGR